MIAQQDQEMDYTRPYAQCRYLEQAFLSLAEGVRCMFQEPHAQVGIAEQEAAHSRRVKKTDGGFIDHFGSGAVALLRQQGPVAEGVALMGETDDCRLPFFIGFPDGDKTTFNEIEALAGITLMKDGLSRLVFPANDIAIEQVNLIGIQRFPFGLGAGTRIKARRHRIVFWLILTHCRPAIHVTSVLFARRVRPRNIASV